MWMLSIATKILLCISKFSFLLYLYSSITIIFFTVDLQKHNKLMSKCPISIGSHNDEWLPE